MSTKPTNAAPWDTTLTNLIAPTAGHQANGFAVNEVPSSSEINGQLHRIGLWTTWLLNTQHAGTANYNLSANTDNAALAGASLNDIHTVYVTSVGVDWNLNGIAHGVDKQEIQLVNAGSFFFWLRHEGAGSLAANRIQIQAAYADGTFIRVYPGGSVKLRYDGTISRWRVVATVGCRALRYLSIPATAAQLQGGSGAEPYGTHGAFPSSGGYWDLDNFSTLDYPVTVPVGAIIDNFRVYYRKNSNATVVLSAAMLQRNASDGVAATIGGTDSDSTNAPGFDFLTRGNIETTATLPVSFYISAGRNPTGGSADVFYHAVVGYWDLI